MMPSCDQIGVPIHFHSSTTSGSASLMSLRILLRVSPRQSPSSAILFEMSSDADWPWLAPDFFVGMATSHFACHYASMLKVKGDFVHMFRRLYENQECSTARTLELVGERWSLVMNPAGPAGRPEGSDSYGLRRS